MSNLFLNALLPELIKAWEAVFAKKVVPGLREKYDEKRYQHYFGPHDPFFLVAAIYLGDDRRLGLQTQALSLATRWDRLRKL